MESPLVTALSQERRKPKILYVVTEDWYFRSHRLPLALAALEAGYEVVVATRLREGPEPFARDGLRALSFSISRRGMNPFKEMLVALRLARLLHRERPDILHLVALKPVLLGNLAARLAGLSGRVSEIAGMGSLFTGKRRRSLISRAIRWVLAYLMRGSRVIVQNVDDRTLWIQSGIPAHDIHLVPGVGVDLQRFKPQPEPPGVPIVALPARLLWHKGIGEFVEAARLLRAWGVKVRMVLVGPIDLDNPSAISEAQVSQWIAEDLLEWWGYQAKMEEIYPRVHIVCLPSYREGLPKVLLEAAACARPVVTTDVPGCREVVRHEFNGLLVPPQDAHALAQALRRLIESPDLRHKMGHNNRLVAERQFDHRKVARKLLEIYQGLLQ